MPTLHGLLFNEDDTDFFGAHRVREGVDGGALVDQYVDLLAEAGVTVLLTCPNARRTNYRSHVWDAYWDGYDPNGPDDQPFLLPVPKDQRGGWRQLVHSMWALDAQGVDYPARMAARALQRGVSPWITLRMNDVHMNDNLAHPFHGAMFREERFFRGGPASYFARALDYAHPEVRDYYRALVVEVLQRYDVDGLELDFMREPYLFAPGQEAEGARLLLDWLRGIRRLVHDASVRRGHPIYLGVRVPSRIEVARGWGLDAVTWAQEGLVDLVVPTPRWATLEYDLPLDEWKQALAGTGVTLAGGLEVLYRPAPDGPAQATDPARAVGAAANVLAAGADVVYLFNYFGSTSSHPYWSRQSYVDTLRAMTALDKLAALPRRHCLTWRDITGPGEQYHAPLPAVGARLDFALPTGPRPRPGSTVAVNLRCAAETVAEGTPPTVTLNGQPCVFRERTATPAGLVLDYAAPTAALTGQRRDTVVVTAAKPVRVLAVEVAIDPPAR